MSLIWFLAGIARNRRIVKMARLFNGMGGFGAHIAYMIFNKRTRERFR